MGKIFPKLFVRTIHFLLAGDESKGLHVAGLSRLRADEVVVFSPKDTRVVDSLLALLKEMGVPNRTVPLDGDYIGAYRKTSHEAAAAFTSTECVGINMSTGSGVLRAAMEDAVRVQLYHFLHHTSTVEASAFKYFVGEAPALTISAVPIWDFATYLHNDIFEILVTAKEPITLAQLHKSVIRTMGREAPNWEAFRKTFREFKRCFTGSPCFVEVVGKGPRYRIQA